MRKVRCKYCQVLTDNDHTSLCDRCWELEMRIKAAGSNLVLKIMSALGMA